jgi:pyrroloquinoline quinone biosynthesis protein D
MNRPHAPGSADARLRPRLRALYRLRMNAGTRDYAIVHPSGSTVLNRSAAEILALCDGIHELDDIIAALEARFHAQGLAADVLRFIDEARCLGWLE